MIRIRVWADIASTGLFFDSGVFLGDEDILLSKDTWKELSKWVWDYEMYIPISSCNWEEVKDEVAEMDRRGIELLKRVKIECNNPEFYFVYYSDALMKYLPVE